jgi:hypothetical protein
MILRWEFRTPRSSVPVRCGAPAVEFWVSGPRSPRGSPDVLRFCALHSAVPRGPSRELAGPLSLEEALSLIAVHGEG